MPHRPRQQRQRAEASLGGDHPTPSRTARKPHLSPSLLSARRLVAAESPPATLPTPAACPHAPSHQQPVPPNTPTALGSSGSEPKRALEAITQPHRAQRESPTSPRASSARVGSLPRRAPQPHSQPQQPVPKVPPANIWQVQHNAGFLDARERVRFPQSFGTNPEHVHEQHR
jgi:hypothetical protein